MLAKTHHVPSSIPHSTTVLLIRRYVRPRAIFEEEDPRFDKLPMVGEGTWDDPVEDEGDVAPEIDVPMAQIVRD